MQLLRKELTIQEVFNAIAVDGYDHLRDTWISFKSFNGEIRPIGACLVGMAAVNLQVAADDGWVWDHAKGALSTAINSAPEEEIYDANIDEYVPNPLFDPEQEIDIIGLSDALDEIIITDPPHFLRKWYASNAPLGGALVSLNDEREQFDNKKYKYSYAELTAMAKELMEPYFDRTIVVTELNYNDASILSV